MDAISSHVQQVLLSHAQLLLMCLLMEDRSMFQLSVNSNTMKIKYNLIEGIDVFLPFAI